MAKTNTPFLSLGSQGSLGNVLTSQKGSSSSILRSKPTPTDRYTLPQAYQRWLYQDYAYLWTLQSAATRAEYRTAGVRHHLTAFQYWMKDMLTRLPDIAAWYKLDDNLGATVIDSSRNENIGTLIGASPTSGIIDGCLSFDGINDISTVPHSLSLNLPTHITIKCWFNPHQATSERFLIKQLYAAWILDRASFDLLWDNNKLRVEMSIGAVQRSVQSAPLPLDTWHRLVATYDGATLKLYVNAGTPTTWSGAGVIGTSTYHLEIGAATVLGQYCFITLDDLWIMNRPIDSTEVARDYKRSYPA